MAEGDLGVPDIEYINDFNATCRYFDMQMLYFRGPVKFVPKHRN